MGANSPLEGIQSAIEMGLVDNTSTDEFEEIRLSSSETESQNTQPENGWSSRILRTSDYKMIPHVVYKSIKTVLLSTKFLRLMPFGPIMIVVKIFFGNEELYTFGVLGTIPLAERLNYATNQLALYSGDRAGCFLNATLGNAAQLIVSICVLKKGMIRMVHLSLLGSIFLNVPLLLGRAFFMHGISFHQKEEKFNKATAVVGSRLLLMAGLGLLFPAIHHYIIDEVDFGKSGMALSRFNSCVMLVAYVACLVFQLKTKKDLYEPKSEEENHPGNNDQNDNSDPEISKCESVIWLVIFTAWLSVLSEYVVDAIQGASTTWNMSMTFLSIILLPFVGNASVIIFALQDKLDNALGAAIDTSIQISMFGIPFCVVVGWIMDRPMDSNFQRFETAHF